MSERDSLLVAQEILSRLADGDNPPSAEELTRTRASLLAAQQKLEEMVKTRDSERDSLAIAQTKLAQLVEGQDVSNPEGARERDSLLIAQEMLGQMVTSRASADDSLVIAKERLAQLAEAGALPKEADIEAEKDSLLMARALLTRMATEKSPASEPRAPEPAAAAPFPAAQPQQPQVPPQQQPQQHLSGPQLSHSPFRQSGPQPHSPFPPQPEGYGPFPSPFAGYQQHPGQPPQQPAGQHQQHPQAAYGYPQAPSGPMYSPFGPVGTGFPSHPMLPAVPRPNAPSDHYQQAPPGMYPPQGHYPVPYPGLPYGQPFPQYAQQPFPQPQYPQQAAHQGVMRIPAGIPMGVAPQSAQGHGSGPSQQPHFEAQHRLAQLARDAAGKAHANAYDSLNVAQRRLAQLAQGEFHASAEELAKERDSILIAQEMLHHMAADRAAAGQLDQFQHAASAASRRLGQLASADAPVLTPEMLAGERDSLLIAEQMLDQLSQQIKAESPPDEDFWIIPENAGTTGRYGGRAIPRKASPSLVLAEDDLAELERRFQQRLLVMAGATIGGVVLLGLIVLFVLF